MSGEGEESDSEVSSVGTRDLSSDYDPADSDEESDADVNVDSRFGKTTADVAKFPRGKSNVPTMV